MPHTSKSHIIVITSILIVFAAIAVNANWGGGFGFSLFAANDESIAPTSGAEPGAPMPVSPTQTITVVNNNNSGAGSLRQAILNANQGDTINFAANVTGSIFLASSLIIDKNLTINGPGADVLGVEGRDQPTESNVFHISAGNATILGLRIANGFSSGAGGGVVVEGGNLTLNNCLIIGNTAESAGGAFVGTSSTLTITNSTISGNTSFVEGGGVSNRGGTLVLTNSTVFGNNAQDGGGIASGIFASSSVSTILNSTITNNTGDGGGLKIGSGSVVNIKNTIVAGNNGSSPDVGGTVNSQGNNLIGNTTGGSGFVLSDVQNQNPLLGAFTNNGGTLSTVSLLSGSPAIDAGSNNTGAPATDQRGVARPQGVRVDIGSYESGVSAWNGQTNAGLNITVPLGSVSVFFPGVSPAGTTTQVPIDPASAGTLPGGYSFGAGFPAYEITTTAGYLAPVMVCLQVPAVTNAATFAALRILHNESGILVDRTILAPDTPAPDFATKTICARVTSLSPFVVASAPAGTATDTPTPTATATNTPTNTPTETATPTPASSPSISGTVTYGNALGNPPPPRFVSNVLISGTGSVPVSTLTGFPGGTYSLTGFGAGSYTVTPTKTGGINGAVSSFDAARISQHASGIPPLFTGNQLIVADVSGNSTISSFDAGMIAKFVSGPPYTPPGVGSTGNWIFIPVSRNYMSVDESITGEDYSALLMGEVSGNWNNTGARPVGSSLADGDSWQLTTNSGPERSIAVHLPKLAASMDKEVIIPVSVQGAANKGIISYEFELRYDPSVIQPLADPVDVAGTVSRGLSVVTNPYEPGLLRVVVYGPMPIDGDGVLVNLRFTAVGVPGWVSPLTWERIMFNEGEPRVTITDGKIELF